MNYLFIYGTLLRYSESEVSEFLHRNSQFVSVGSFCGKLFDVSGYPGAIYLPEEMSSVSGNILEISSPESVFAVLDLYEEVGPEFPEPNEYVRKRIPVRSVSGEIFYCWVYIYNWPVDYFSQITSGDYQKYRRIQE